LGLFGSGHISGALDKTWVQAERYEAHDFFADAGGEASLLSYQSGF
jgi:hypothetical protein